LTDLAEDLYGDSFEPQVDTKGLVNRLENSLKVECGERPRLGERSSRSGGDRRGKKDIQR
jgi:hypothetical protein